MNEIFLKLELDVVELTASCICNKILTFFVRFLQKIMTDFRAEQKDEIEAIESIYSEEIDIISENPHRFTIPVKTEEYDDEESDEGMMTLLKFTLPDTYPEVIPQIDIEE